MRKTLFLAASILTAGLATAAFAQSNTGSAGSAPSGNAAPSASAPSASPNGSGSAMTAHHARARHRGEAGNGVRRAQQALQSKGLYQGKVDGKYGPQTKAALMQFQQQNNLKQTGRLDRETRVALRGGAPGNGAMTQGGGMPPNATPTNPMKNAGARSAPSGSSMVPPGAGMPKTNPGPTQPAQ